MTSFTLTQHFDDFDHDFTVTFPLPFLEKFGVRMLMHDAVHKAATHRKIIAALGGKGLGKTERLKHARAWFEDVERQRHEVDNSYAPQRMLIRKSSRNDTYHDTLIGLSLELDSRKPIKERGRNKSPSQLLEQNAILLREKRVAVIGLDEGEVLRKETINAFRDVVAFAGDTAKESGGGVGLVIVGSPVCDTLLHGHDEFGHRIAEIVRIPPVSIEDTGTVLQTWLPKLKALSGDDTYEFRNLVRVNICRERPTHMRKLEWIMKEYARRLQMSRRLVGVNGWAEVPVDLKLLRVVADSYAEGLSPWNGGSNA